MDDQEAIERSCRGEPDAFRVLVERYEKEAYAHALSICGHVETARDCVQDAFLDAFRSLGRFDVKRSFYPWLYTLLRHRCYKQFMRVKNDASGDRAGFALLQSTLEAPEQGAVLQELLMRMDPEHREILVLRHLDELSYREISERLDIPIGTVMSRLYSARRNLRQRFSEREKES